MTGLQQLPRPADRRVAVRVTPDAQRRIRAGHPWIYDRSIRSVSHDGAPGDLAVVFDDDRRFVAIGLWDPASPIRIKVLHQGRPVVIDRAWFDERIGAAIARRAPLLDPSSGTTGLRLVHGENDGLPGLVVDAYGAIAVIKVYTDAWVPHLVDVVGALAAQRDVRSVVLRLARALRDRPLHGLVDGAVVRGSPVDGPVPFSEAGLSFEADVVRGQKTGHFLDQRDNRIRVGALAAGRRVLDVFSCTGGFGVHAAAGGAHLVHSVDASPHAIEAARRNMARNAALPAVRACEHQASVGDAFQVMAELAAARRRFDLVVVDPPSFAQNAPSVPRALAAYERLTEHALALVARDGVLVQASCSSRVGAPEFYRAVHVAAARAGYDVEEIERTGHPLDHPIGFPEGAYLKALFARPHRTGPGAAAPPAEREGATPKRAAPGEPGRRGARARG